MRIKESKLDNIPEQRWQTYSRPSVKPSHLFLISFPHFEDGRDKGEEQKWSARDPWAAIFPSCLHSKHSNKSQPSLFWNQKEPQNPPQHRTLSCSYQLHGYNIWDETYLLFLDWIISKVAAEIIWAHNKWRLISKIIQLSGRQIFQSKHDKSNKI